MDHRQAISPFMPCLLIVSALTGCAPIPVAPSPEAQPLTVTGLSLAVGSTFGGSTVVITGTGFHWGARVTFGGVSASFLGTETAFLSEGSLYVSTPPHAPGIVTVVVTNPGGQSVAVSNGYTYATPGFFDFEGDWDGATGPDWQTPVQFTILKAAFWSARFAETARC